MPQTAKTATMKKLLLLLAALFAISAGGICCSGSGDDPGEQEKPVDPPPSPGGGVDWSKIDPKATVRGVVTCAGAAVQGAIFTAVWRSEVVAPPMMKGMCSERRSASSTTWIISSSDGVIRPLRQIASAPHAAASSTMRCASTMTPRSRIS